MPTCVWNGDSPFHFSTRLQAQSRRHGNDLSEQEEPSPWGDTDARAEDSFATLPLACERWAPRILPGRISFIRKKKFTMSISPLFLV